ncbi:class I adenylate-forming enzyme family protein [Magnetovibrio sp. PR-2]|uniref:class I adenylate-forming enzyme family protein n=1 Tax=Magnetovibrio sp. PR-2 TaxID=3120356 RepID=UPI002FCE5C48
MGSLYSQFQIQAQRHADKTALIYEGNTYTYAEILNRADKWAEHFCQIQPARPRVAILTDHPLHIISATLGLAKIDGVSIPSNSSMHPDQLSPIWRACDVNIVLREPYQSDLGTQHKLPGVIEVSPGDEDASTGTQQNLVRKSAETDFLITFSSGSTGQPKPIVISQDVKLKRAQQAWDMYELTSEDVVLCASPFYHSLGQRHVFVALLMGATLVYMKRFTPRDWLALVAKHKVTFFTAVSTHLYALKDSLMDNVDQLKSLKTIVTSSAPIDAQFKEDLYKAINCQFHEIYGTSEVACATNLFPRDARTKSATVGSLCDGVDLKILDQDRMAVGMGEVGEIAVRSPLAFEGYYQQPERTAASFHDNYFLTGDLGFIDESGFLTYLTRQKDIIISGGINIYPKDIEETLSRHERLKEIAVIGVVDDLLGEVIVAVCVTPNQENLEKELRKIANDTLAPFQRPLKYFFVDSLPLTSSGKVSKKTLRETYSPLNQGWTDPLRYLLYGQ